MRMNKWSHRLVARQLLIERGDTYLLRGVHCVLRSGVALHLVGANGSGKSSLMRALCGISPVTSGTLELDGASCADGRLPAQCFHYIGHAIGVQPVATPLETLMLWQAYYCTSHSQSDLLDLLAEHQLATHAHHVNDKLSHGQNKRLALLRVKMAPRPFWFLDEVHAGLDSQAMNLLNGMINMHLTQGGIVCFTAHDEQTISAPVETLHLHNYQFLTDTQ